MIVIKIHGVDKDMSAIYERVRKYWKINPEKADNAQFILACRNGLIVGVFEKTGSWKRADYSNRCYFEGRAVQDKEILTRFLNKCYKTPKGASNPVQYVGDWK